MPHEESISITRRQWWFCNLERGTRTGPVVPLCLWQCGSHAVPPPSPLLFTRTQTTSQYPQAIEGWTSMPTTATHTPTRMHTQRAKPPQIPSKEVGFWKMKMSEVSVSLRRSFRLFNHQGLKGHTEFSGDEEACWRGGAAAEMSNSERRRAWETDVVSRQRCLSQGTSLRVCTLSQEHALN